MTWSAAVRCAGRPTSRARGVLFAAALAVVALGCRWGKNPEVAFSITVPGSVQSEAAWYEIGAFRGTTCEALAPQLAGGIPLDGASARLAFKKADKAPPPLGDLHKDKYAFGAVARKDDCSVIGTGCADVDVNDSRSVDITLEAVSQPRGACTAGSVCQGARCVPANDDNDPSIGAGCSLQLVGTGPLGNPLGVTRTKVSSPAVVATSKGFLVAYRENDGAAARLTVLPIDNGGGALAPKRTTTESCEAVDPDATGLAYDGEKVTLAVGQRCGGNGGIFVRRLTDEGDKDSEDTFNTSGQDQATLAPSHSLAFRSGGKAVLVFSQSGLAGVAEFTGTRVSFTQFPPFGGTPPQTAAWVGASDQMIALLALGSGAAGVDDAGTEGGTSTGDTTLRLQMVAGNATFNSLPAPFQVSKATWGALAVNGKLAAIAYDGVSPNKPVAWKIYELGNGQPVFQDGFTTEGAVKVAYTDVAFFGDRMFFAVERGGSVSPQTDTVTVEGTISLVAYDRATKSPQLVRTVNLSKDPRIPALKRVRDGLLAVGASESRVLVVWVNARELLPNDIVGGYALFACTP